MNKLAYNSRLYLISPALKAICSVVSLVCVITADRIIFSAVMLVVMSVMCTAVSGLKIGRYLRLLSIPIVFLTIGALVIAIGVSDIAQGLFSIRVAGIYLYVSETSIISALSLILKSLSAVSCLYFLYVTTPIEHIIGLLTRMRLPKIMTEMMLLILRFIFILLDLSKNMSTAQNSRLGNRNFSARLRSSSTLISSLFVKAFIKSEDILKAMESRGYDGRVDFVRELRKPLKKHMFAATVYCMFAITAVILLRR